MDGVLSRRYRLGLFGSIYVVQGIAFAFFRNYYKPYLNAQGLSADLIAILSFFLFLPFITKVLVGILSDRLNLFGMGHRKPYIMIGLFLTAVSLCAAAFTSADRHLVLFGLFTTLASFGMSLADAVTDGFAIEVTPRDERGLLQGVMVGGRGSALVLFSLIFGAILHWHNGVAVFVIMGVSILLPLFWVYRITESSVQKAPFSWTAFKGLKEPHRIIFAGYALVIAIGAFGTEGIATYYLRVRFDGTDIAIGQYGALRGVGAISGALLCTWLIARLGRVRIAYASAVMISVVTVAFSCARNADDVLHLAFVWGLVWAIGETIFAVLAMDISDPRIAAATFAVMLTISNLAGGVAEGTAVALSDDIGFDMLFWGLAAVNLIAVPILHVHFKASSAARQSLPPDQCLH